MAIIGYTRKSNYLILFVHPVKGCIAPKKKSTASRIDSPADLVWKFHLFSKLSKQNFNCFTCTANLSRTPWGNARRLKCLEGWSILAQGSLNDTLIVYGIGYHITQNSYAFEKGSSTSQSAANSRNFSNDSNSIVQLLPPVFTICNSR